MFEPIAQGHRGPAVEDIQKRLLTLGLDLGPTGVDGVYGGITREAVRRFQTNHGLAADGTVSGATWSALVDATFQLGDRLLYLKIPYFHGADVCLLQGALNVLGFAAGQPDGIFGTFTERAVGEFQANVGLPADGIAGPETIRAVERLRHVWQGKDPSSSAAFAVAPARAAEVLRRAVVGVVCLEPGCRAIGERLANLAQAAEPRARVLLAGNRSPEMDLALYVTTDPEHAAARKLPVIALSAAAHAPLRFMTAFQSVGAGFEAVVLVPRAAADREHDAQATAVWILDGVCALLATGTGGSVLP